MSGLFNSFYYGKAGKADFTPDQLPKNRVQLFFSMLRIRFGGLIAQNLLYLLFNAPAILWTVINISVLMSTLGEFDAETGALLTAGASAAEFNGYLMIYVLGMIPCMMISAIGRMGQAYIYRNWARDDHSFVMSDFKDTIKDNWKRALLIGFMNGLSLLITYVCFRYYGSMGAAGSMFWMIPQVLVVIFCCMWWMANMLIFPMTVTYDMSFRTILQNSLIMVIARLPMSFLIWAPNIVIPYLLITFIPMTYVILVVALYFALIGFALYHFMSISYANSCFDRFLNPRIEGADVNKGLRDPSYNDEDDTVTEEDIKNL